MHASRTPASSTAHGVPADVAGQVTRAPPAWEHVRRILAACITAREYGARAGDTPHVAALAPALRLVRRVLPGCHLSLLVVPEARDTAARLDVDDVLVLPLVLPLARPLPLSAAERVPSASGDAWPVSRATALVETIRGGRFDAAIVFTEPGESPYLVAYACCLAGVPRRLGASVEFGGGVLEPPVELPATGTHPADRALMLLERAGFIAAAPVDPAAAIA